MIFRFLKLNFYNFFLSLFLLLFPLASFAQKGSSEKYIDYLKAHLTYPKYDKGDTVYVWFQTRYDKPINYQPGIIIHKCTIIDIFLTNAGDAEFKNGFSLSYCEPCTDKELEFLYKIDYAYQLLPVNVKQILGNSLKILVSEDRLFRTYKACKVDSERYKE